MNIVKRAEVRNMEYFEIKTTYNVLNKSFDTEAEAKEYARRLNDLVSLYTGGKSLEEWIEVREQAIPNNRYVSTTVNDCDLVYTLGDIELTIAGYGGQINHIRVNGAFSSFYTHKDGKVKIHSVAITDKYCK